MYCVHKYIVVLGDSPPSRLASGFVVVHLPSLPNNVFITFAAPKVLYRLKRGPQQ